jgi:hypothetical protein
VAAPADVDGSCGTDPKPAARKAKKTKKAAKKKAKKA